MQTYKLILQPYGARYLTSTIRQDLFQWLKNNDIEVETYMESYKELNIPKHMRPNYDEDEYSSWSEDFRCQEDTGICLSESCRIEVYGEDDVIWSSDLDPINLKKHGIKFDEPDDYLNSEDEGTIFFVGEYNSKDYMEYEIESDGEFDPKHLEFETMNINGVVFITSVNYHGADINFIDGGGEDKGWSFFFHLSKGSKAKSPHLFKEDECTKWFDVKTLPSIKGQYEVKKCDEEVANVMLKWDGKSFNKTVEKYDYDKKFNKINVRFKDEIVPLTDILLWRGLKKKC